MMWTVRDTDLQFHQALENRCILHSSSIQCSQHSLSNPNSWVYPTYVSQKTAPFSRMEENSFSFVFHDFQFVLLKFLLSHLCSAQPSSLKPLPTPSPPHTHHVSPNFAGPTSPVVSTKPYSPCDTCCVGWHLMMVLNIFSGSCPETDYQVDADFSASLHCPWCLSKWHSMGSCSISTHSINLTI